MCQSSLSLHTVYFDDDDRAAAVRLGTDLYESLTRPSDQPLAFGAGIPVFAGVSPEKLDLDGSERVVLIPVLGKSSYLTSREHAIERIARWHTELGDGHVLPVFISHNWREAEGELPGKTLLTTLYGAESTRARKTVDEIVIATSRLFASDVHKVRLFVSHAKSDLTATGEAASRIHAYVVSDTTCRAFFDATDFLVGEALSSQLDDAATTGVFVAVRSDSYSSRSWCQRELLGAKTHGVPTLTVELLAAGEDRSSAYGGNGPSVVWKGDPQPVVSRALVEWLRASVFLKDAERVKADAQLPEDTVTLTRPPELLDIAQGRLSPNRTHVALYPDPELAIVEKDVLLRASPRLHLVTPTTAYRAIGRNAVTQNPLDGVQVAMSLSDSPDVDGDEGFRDDHVEDATVYLARCLVAAGASIAYGGDFRRNGYTPLLADLVVAHKNTAAPDADLLHSYIAAHLGVGDAPDDLKATVHHLGKKPWSGKTVLPPPKGTEHPPALYFSDMRRVMAGATDARVLLGGAAEPRVMDGGAGYGGRYPGVVEEAWWTLTSGKPLYVVGGLGGGARLVAQLLTEGDTPERLQDRSWLGHEHYRATAERIDADPFREQLGLPHGMEDLANAIREQGAHVLSGDPESVTWNGLTVEENHRLFKSRNGMTIASLVVKGLMTVCRREAEGKLDVELVHGDIRHANGLELAAVASFDGLPLGGAGAVLDRALAGRASLARSRGEVLINVDSGEIGADYLYVASLGPLDELAGQDETHALKTRVRDAANATHGLARRHGFSRLGVVAYGGSVVDEVEEVAGAMLDGLTKLAGEATVAWFETNEQVFDRLRTCLSRDDRVRLTTRSDQSQPTPPPLADRKWLVVHTSLANDELRVTAVPPAGTGVVNVYRSTLTGADLSALARGEGGRNRRTPSMSALEERGDRLATTLFGGDASALLAHCRDAKILVIHDVASSKLPFEVLSVGARGPDERLRPATQGGVNRRLAVAGVPIEQVLGRPPRAGSLRVLLVVNPTSDLEGTEREARAIKTILENGHVALDGKERIDVCELWRADATKDAVLARLADADVLHYSGHAFFDGPGDDQNGLKLADGDLSLRELRGWNLPVRLAFMNACESARVRGEPVEPAACAELFLRSGTEAFLGTYWEVSDAGAATFAMNVYARLASGETLDDAVCAARDALLTAGEPDWANYLLYGDGRFRFVSTGSPP